MNHHRQIEEEEEEMSLENDNDDDDDTTFLYNDLSTYSIRYEKCQFVKMYDDELASNQAAQQYSSSSSSSPLATKHFVIYRLCPTDTCSSSSTSTSSSTHNACGTEDSTVPFGTYTMTVEEYLYYTITYQKQVLEESCNFCNAYCLSSSSSSSSSYYCTSDCTNTMCHSCSTTCDDYQAYTTAIVNGVTNIVDAANYIQCQKLELSNNNNNNAAVDDTVNNNEAQDNNNIDDDNDNNIAIQYYIGPYCQSVHTTSTNTAPTSISIGLFSDENCYSPITNINMTEVLGGITLSYHLFKHTTSTSSTSTTSSSSSSKTKNPMQCLSCLETMNNNNNNNDMNDVDDVNEMCENLYTVSAKCESTTGLQYGFIQMHRNNNNNNNNNDENENEQKNNNNNQVENEFMVCTFIQSLLYNSYTQTGIIDIRVPQDYIIRTLSRRQGNTLILLSFILVSMIGAIYYYHTKIQQQLIHPSIIMTTTTTTKTTNRNQKMLLIRDGEMS